MAITLEAQSNIHELREYVRQLLADAYKKSKTSGKPLLILIGENHEMQSCALLEALIYQESKTLGIRDVALEADKNLLSIFSKAELHRFGLTGEHTIQKIASFHGDKIHAVDARRHEALTALADKRTRQDLLALESRNDSISANLLNIGKPTIFVGGYLHLAGLLDKQALHDSYEIIAFDVASKAHSIKSTLRKLHDREIHRLTTSFPVEGLTTKEFMHLALGTKEGDHFLHWAVEKRHAPNTISSLVACVNLLPKQLQSIGSHLSKAIALYDLGFDRKAGDEFCQFSMQVQHSNSKELMTHLENDLQKLGVFPINPSVEFKNGIEEHLHPPKTPIHLQKGATASRLPGK